MNQTTVAPLESSDVSIPSLWNYGLWLAAPLPAVVGLYGMRRSSATACRNCACVRDKKRICGASPVFSRSLGHRVGREQATTIHPKRRCILEALGRKSQGTKSHIVSAR